jgi:glutamate/tyrosine decarboxylase-like PLP-dependent enzyme
MDKEIVLRNLFDLIHDWIDKSSDPGQPVNNYYSPQELSEKLNLSIPSQGISEDEFLSEMKSYLDHAVKTAHPQYLNQLFGGFNLPAFVGEVITALTNTSMYTYEVAPVATLIENQLIDKMLSYTGWETGTGSFLTGGSNTNMVAMLLARNSVVKKAKQEGITGAPKLVAFVSEKSHFSMLKAANTIGIGQENVIKVKVDENGRMRGESLRKSIKSAKNKGLTPFIVCSTAGTTETGSFDAIDEIADVTEDFGVWHHVDGSWGGSSILSEKRKHYFAGLERADSFSWNPHKLMSIPLICSVLLVKDPDILSREIRSYDADYIYHDNDSSAYDLGPASLQCGRRVDALKLWLSWKHYGDHGYAERIEKVYDLAQYATEVVKKTKGLELLFPTQSLNVNFRYTSEASLDLNELNKSARYALIRQGKAMVNYCHIDDKISIRLVLLNPDLQKSDIDDFFHRFLETAREIEVEMGKVPI